MFIQLCSKKRFSIWLGSSGTFKRRVTVPIVIAYWYYERKLFKFELFELPVSSHFYVNSSKPGNYIYLLQSSAIS